jgi:hypothetical protein
LVVGDHEVSTSDEDTRTGGSDKGEHRAHGEQNIECTGVAGMKGRGKWCSQRARRGVDGLSGVALLNGSDGPGQVSLEGWNGRQGLAQFLA